MIYWHIQMNQPQGRGGKVIDSAQMLKERQPVIGTGEWDDLQCRYFKNEDSQGLKFGDIILVREGQKPLALCQVSGDYFEDASLTAKYINQLFRPIKILEWYNGNEKFPQAQKTLERLVNPNTDSWKFINKWYSKVKSSLAMKNILDILKLKKQIVLQGAPGTGKTYKTAEIALAILGIKDIDFSDRDAVMQAYNKAIEDGYIAFTTFHQSMDYEEFVEGLKPDNEDGISYIVTPGIFKTICQNAQTKGDLDKLNNAIEQLKKDCAETPITAQTRRGINFSVTYRGGQTFRVRSEKSEAVPEKDYPVNIESVRQLYMGDDTGYNISYVHGILDYIKKKYKVGDYKDSKGSQNYVLIVDEINRGNVAKIFGELITLLEADKRIGEKNEIKVQLPYSPEKKFGVPSNLYLIGTMNTADRSIGHIDYAIRRRFAFVTLKADENIIKTYYKKDTISQSKALTLFNDIKEFLSKNINPDFDVEDVMIGHSYFLCNEPDDLKLKLEYEIIPLLHEYEKDGLILTSKEELAEECDKWMRQL